MVYEYKCAKGHYFEKSYRMGEAPKKETCPCGQKGERVFSMLSVSTQNNHLQAKSREYYKGGEC